MCLKIEGEKAASMLEKIPLQTLLYVYLELYYNYNYYTIG